MEIDISRKIIPVIKFALPVVILTAVIINTGIWFYRQHNTYIAFYDAHVAGTFLQTKTLTDGTLESFLVKDGEEVTIGQPLAEIRPNITEKDIENLKQAVDQAQEQYDNMVVLNKNGSTRIVSNSGGGQISAAANNQYQSALANENKMRSLYEIGAVSKAEYERAAAAVESARAALNSGSSGNSIVTVPSGVTGEDIQMAQIRLNQAKLALEEAQKNTDIMQLFASANGTVYFTDVKPGSKISAGQDVLDIGTASYMWLEMKTTEQQAAKLQEGAYAECKINGKIIEGSVEKIIPPSADEENYIVKVIIPSDKMMGMKPNMITTVRILVTK